MITDYLWFFIALAALLGLQLYFTARQSQAFMADVRRLRGRGCVAIGLHGRKWFGRKAYVALAADQDGAVVDAIVLRGLTHFARATAVPALVGRPIAELVGEGAVPMVDPVLRAAARQAAQTLSASGGLQATGGVDQGKEGTQPAWSHLN